MNEQAELGPGEDNEYSRFESFAQKLVNTPKPKPSAEDLPLTVAPAGEPAEDGAEREEADRDGH